MSEQSRSIVQAIEQGNTQIAQELCHTYREQLALSGELQYLLDYAAGANRPDVLDVLLATGANINQPVDKYSNQGVLYTAVACGSVNSVRWLLTHGAEVNLPNDGVLHCLPLYVAIREGHYEIAKMLVEHGAITSSVWNGETPYECALSCGRLDIAACLLSANSGLSSTSE